MCQMRLKCASNNKKQKIIVVNLATLNYFSKYYMNAATTKQYTYLKCRTEKAIVMTGNVAFTGKYSDTNKKTVMMTIISNNNNSN